jgi:hypothetical protein
VLARRVLVLSPDRAFAGAVEAALRAAIGDVDVDVAIVDGAEQPAPGAGDPGAALCVVHLEGELARGELLARLTGGPVIAVLPRASLAAVVELMQAGERVVGVVAAEGDAARHVAAMAARVFAAAGAAAAAGAGDIFGLERVVAPGTQIHAQEVGDFREKTLCMAQIAALLEQAAVARRHREPIEQCLDEMLMNALYDAPVDAAGKHVFAGVPVKTRITQRTEQRVAVQYALGGGLFAVAVRDAFGSLERGTVLRHLHRGLHAAQQIERKAGGAGLGLYLMAHAATAVYFHVLPGIATEVICVFELEAPRLTLERFGFLVQRAAAGRVPAGPARALPAVPPRRSRLGRKIAAALAVAGCAVIAALAWPRVFGEPPPAPAPPTVELASEPAGADVEIDGQPVGSTPLTLTTLPPGATVEITFKQRGYRTATARLEVPAAGASARVMQPLARSDEFVRVRFVSSPPGAEVVRSGQAPTTDRTYTPAELFVEAGREQRFTLTMPRHVPLVIEPFTPARGEQGLEKGGTLVPGATLRIEATLAGKATVAGAPHCAELALPAACTLAPGRHVVEYLGEGGARIARTVTLADAADEGALVRFELGIVEAAPGKLLLPGGVRRLVLEAGPRTVTVSDAAGAGAHKATVRVEPGATVVAD